MIRIVLNLAADRRKRVAARRLVSLDRIAVEELPRTPPAPELGPIRKEAIDRAVRELPPRQRETLILRVFQELRFQEIATVMGCSVGTAKANFFHAIKGLRARVKVASREFPRGPAGEVKDDRGV